MVWFPQGMASLSLKISVTVHTTWKSVEWVPSGILVCNTMYMNTRSYMSTNAEARQFQLSGCLWFCDFAFYIMRTVWVVFSVPLLFAFLLCAVHGRTLCPLCLLLHHSVMLDNCVWLQVHWEELQSAIPKVCTAALWGQLRGPAVRLDTWGAGWHETKPAPDQPSALLLQGWYTAGAKSSNIHMHKETKANKKHHRPAHSSTCTQHELFVLDFSLPGPYGDPEMVGYIFPFSSFNSHPRSAFSLTFLHSCSIKDSWKPRVWFSHPFLSAPLTKKWSLSTAILPFSHWFYTYPHIPPCLFESSTGVTQLLTIPSSFPYPLPFLFFTWKASCYPELTLIPAYSSRCTLTLLFCPRR